MAVGLCGAALSHGLGRRRELVPASSAILIVLDCLAAGGAESDGRGPSHAAGPTARGLGRAGGDGTMRVTAGDCNRGAKP